MKRITTQSIIKKLERKFPHCWFRQIDGVITSGENSFIDEMEAFNYNSGFDDPQETVWTLGVNNDLMNFVDGLGYYWECQDPGTYKLYEH